MSYRNIHRALLLALLLFSSGHLWGQPQWLVADRPGFATGTHAVTPGNVYLELGYQYSFKNNNVSFSELPLVNLRFGLVQNWEVFVEWEGWGVNHKANAYTSDIALPTLGSKYRLLTADEYNITLLGLLQAGDDEGKVITDPALAILWDYEMGDQFELFGMGQAGWQVEPSMAEWVVVMGVGMEINTKTETFAEYYTVILPEVSQVMHGTELGLMYKLNPDIQVDVYAGIGLSEYAEHYTGLGIARRF